MRYQASYSFRKLAVTFYLAYFPRLETETEALLKYADWLERMGIAIRREARRAIKRGVE